VGVYLGEAGTLLRGDPDAALLGDGGTLLREVEVKPPNLLVFQVPPSSSVKSANPEKDAESSAKGKNT
jgi:hypothetical protein